MYAPVGLRGAAIAALINGTAISIESSHVVTAGQSEAAYQTQLLPALQAGDITIHQLQAAATRALLPRFHVGLYDPPELVPWNSIPASVIESSEHHALARRAAAESFVLLKNRNGLLPFKTAAMGGPKVIAVVGVGANYTKTSINRYSGHPKTSSSVWDGINAAAAAGGGKATLGGSNAAAVEMVRTADVAVIVVTGEYEGESHDRQELGVPPNQLEFLTALIATKVPLIVCSISGGAVDVSLAQEHTEAVIAMYAGGMEAGNALADVIFGSVNPSGALAATVYKTSWVNASDFLSMSMRKPPGRTHRYLEDAALTAHVLYPFGYGLSYSNWAAVASVSTSIVSAAELSSGGVITVSVSISIASGPSGSRASWVMISRHDPDPVEAWPRQWLPIHGFAKVHGVVPGGSVIAKLTITARDLSRWDEGAHRFQVHSGTYLLHVRDAMAESTPITVTVK